MLRNHLKNCLATTGLSTLLLALTAIFYDARFLCIETVFQIFAANVLIYAGLLLLHRFECRYYMVEIVIEIGYVLTVLVLAGIQFDWYSSTPLWVLILLGIVIYAIGCLIDIFRIRGDVASINLELKLRQQRTVQ